MTEALQKIRDCAWMPIFQNVLDHKGCVFGGCLRDIVQGTIPNDIDVVKPYECPEDFDKFASTFIKMGYTFRENDVGEQFFESKTLPTIHVIELEEEDTIAANERLSPCCDPDFSVNFLAFDSLGLYNWVDMSNPDDIIKDIEEKKTFIYKPSEERREKMKQKSFQLKTEYVWKDPISPFVSSYMKVAKELFILQCQIKKANEKTADLYRQIDESNRIIKEFNEISKKRKATTS